MGDQGHDRRHSAARVVGVPTPETLPLWWCCVGTDALVADQGGVVVVRLVVLLPHSELLTGKTVMVRGPLQTDKQTTNQAPQVHMSVSVAVQKHQFSVSYWRSALTAGALLTVGTVHPQPVGFMEHPEGTLKHTHTHSCHDPNNKQSVSVSND